MRGSKNHNWKGGMYFTKGRRVIMAPECSRGFSNGYAFEHTVIAEKALGKPLPKQAVVHHVNGKKAPNVNPNLVLCEDDNYHRFIHKRKRAYEACGNSHWVKCTICKTYDDPLNLYIRPDGIGYHRECRKYKSRRLRQVPNYGYRPCLYCETLMPLSTKRDLERKLFCSHSCNAKWNWANGNLKKRRK
ncbi:MAG: HNH endonuclease [Deltaproteobacteria bacterium]|nr:HNH endonuclease [Deltaproteobacteria bacterium]